MSHNNYSYSQWTDKEIEERLKLYQNNKGYLDIRKLNVSQFADRGFTFSLIVAFIIFIGSLAFFAMTGKLWSEEHLISLGILEGYPLLAAGFMGIYVILLRYDEIKFYYNLKNTLKERNNG